MKKLSPILAALVVGLTACQPNPAQTPPTPAQPGQVTPPEPTTPPIVPGPAVTTLAATVVIPSGAINKLHTGLRTQATASVTAADLANFKLSVGGQTLTADQFSFSDISIDQHGQLVATLTISGATLEPGSIMTLATPSGTVAMKGFVPAAGASTRIDITSTAQALIAEQMQADGKTADPATFPAAPVQLVIDRLLSELTGTGSGNVLTAMKLVTTVQEVTGAISGGKGTDSTTLTRIRHMFDTFGGGGGGGGGASYVQAPAKISLIRGPQIAADVTFAEDLNSAQQLLQLRAVRTPGAQAATDVSFEEAARLGLTLNAVRGTQTANDVTFAEDLTSAQQLLQLRAIRTPGVQAATDVSFD